MADLKIADLQVYNGTTWQEFTDTDSAITTAYKCRNNIIYLANEDELDEDEIKKKIQELENNLNSLQEEVNNLKNDTNKIIQYIDIGKVGKWDDFQSGDSKSFILVGSDLYDFITKTLSEECYINLLKFNISFGTQSVDFYTFLNNQSIGIAVNSFKLSSENFNGLFRIRLTKIINAKQVNLILKGVNFDTLFGIDEKLSLIATTVDNLAKATPTDIKGDNGDSGDINTFRLKLMHDNQEITPQNPVLINMPKTFLIDNDTRASVELNAGVDFPSGEGGAKVFCDIKIIPLGSDEDIIVTNPRLTFTFSKTGNLVDTHEIPYEIAFLKFSGNEGYRIIEKLDEGSGWQSISGLPQDPEDLLEKITIEGTFDYPLFVEIRTNKMSNDAINS